MGTRVPCDPAPTPRAPFAPSATTATVVATTTAIIRAGIRRGPATIARGTEPPLSVDVTGFGPNLRPRHRAGQIGRVAGAAPSGADMGEDAIQRTGDAGQI